MIRIAKLARETHGATGHRILAIDVGAGTQDVLLYDASKKPENCIKMILPSQAQVLSKAVRSAREDLIFRGSIMGGGISPAIFEHIKKGYDVFMTENSARSIRDDLEQVKQAGIKIIGEKEAGRLRGKKLETRDVDFELIEAVLNRLGESTDFDCVGIAVQDHGHETGQSDRIFRFEKFKEALEKDANITSLLFEKPPGYFTRMNSVLLSAKKRLKTRIFICDTKIAAVAGALHGIKERPVIAVDIGNGHTIAALAGRGYELAGILEHHTGMLTKRKLENLILKFAEGNLTNEQIFNDGGHGCCIKQKVGFRKIKKILVTGPNRRLLEGSKLKPEFAFPFGDVMLAGAAGIVDMITQWPCKTRH